jgi:segregation and condensation protein B
MHGLARKLTDEEGAAEAADSADAIRAPQTRPEELRILEALLFASKEPLDEKTLAERLPEGVELGPTLQMLRDEYAPRGVNLVKVNGKWTFRTANDLAWLLTREAVQPRKLSRAAIETLAVIAYHQPVTRAEVEDIRGVTLSKGTIDVLLETGWIRPRGRRKVPGRPITYGTTEAFISHFGLEQLNDLPGLEELKGAGMLEGHLPPNFSVPVPNDDPTLREDEDPLEPGDLDLALAPRPEVEDTEDQPAEMQAEAAAETDVAVEADAATEVDAAAEADVTVEAEFAAEEGQEDRPEE